LRGRASTRALARLYDPVVDLAVPPYALLDFGDGRRLERFGLVILDRPAPGAAGVPVLDPASWARADARFGRAAGTDDLAGWDRADALPSAWEVVIEGLHMELRPTPAGQVGLFPEHAEPAAWAAGRIAGAAARLGRPPNIVNLFAYTGLVTLALARAGARVVHVDASRPAVAWARRNAVRAGLGDAPVRWIVEDARAFVAREGRRGRRYDGVVLDPPTYGHAPRGGSAWRIETDLGPLLAGCAALTGPAPALLLLTAHTTGLDVGELRAAIHTSYGRTLERRAEAIALGLRRPDGRQLPAGIALRWAP
jgi:23S rRNA (cytosine1962-C5)-methyltransferase